MSLSEPGYLDHALYIKATIKLGYNLPSGKSMILS